MDAVEGAGGEEAEGAGNAEVGSVMLEGLAVERSGIDADRVCPCFVQQAAEPGLVFAFIGTVPLFAVRAAAEVKEPFAGQGTVASKELGPPIEQERDH